MSKHTLSKEVAQALRRGEFDYAETLNGMGLVRSENNVVHVDHLNENQKLGFDHFVRRIRDAV